MVDMASLTGAHNMISKGPDRHVAFAGKAQADDAEP